MRVERIQPESIFLPQFDGHKIAAKHKNTATAYAVAFEPDDKKNEQQAAPEKDETHFEEHDDSKHEALPKEKKTEAPIATSVDIIA